MREIREPWFNKTFVHQCPRCEEALYCHVIVGPGMSVGTAADGTAEYRVHVESTPQHHVCSTDSASTPVECECLRSTGDNIDCPRHGAMSGVTEPPALDPEPEYADLASPTGPEGDPVRSAESLWHIEPAALDPERSGVFCRYCGASLYNDNQWEGPCGCPEAVAARQPAEGQPPDVKAIIKRSTARRIYHHNTGELGEPRIVTAHRWEAENDIALLLGLTAADGPSTDALQTSGTVDILEQGVDLLKARYGADLTPAPEDVRRYVAVAEQVIRDWREAWAKEQVEKFFPERENDTPFRTLVAEVVEDTPMDQGDIAVAENIVQRAWRGVKRAELSDLAMYAVSALRQRGWLRPPSDGQADSSGTEDR